MLPTAAPARIIPLSSSSAVFVPRLFSVSAQLRRRQRSSPQNKEAKEEIKGVGFAVFSALESGPPSPKSLAPGPKQSQDAKRQMPSEGSKCEEEQRESSLRGSDILFALQKAAAQKKKKRKSIRKGKGRVLTATREGSEDDDLDYHDVRPLNVRSDWGPRLDELEKALRELQKHEQ